MIIAEQRISDLDLKLIDRDDVDHLFKNEYGFTFGERKRFWNAIQKLVCFDSISIENVSQSFHFSNRHKPLKQKTNPSLTHR